MLYFRPEIKYSQLDPQFGVCLYCAAKEDLPQRRSGPISKLVRAPEFCSICLSGRGRGGCSPYAVPGGGFGRRKKRHGCGFLLVRGAVRGMDGGKRGKIR
jgi:hypothetical protein